MVHNKTIIKTSQGNNKRRIASFGWRPDLPDVRDHHFSVSSNVITNLPPKVDLRNLDTPILDQGRIGSCTANAIAGAIAFDRKKFNQAPEFIPSRLFIYYNERSLEGSISTDSGAMIRDGIKSINKLGAPPESLWPYDDTPPAVDGGAWPKGAKAIKKPTASVYKQARNYTLVSYQRLINNLNMLKGALASGYPFVFGFTVYENLWGPDGSPQTHIPIPGNSSAVGGHAVMAVGYDDKAQELIIRNSWGTSLGDAGYFYLPYEYLPNNASDFWVVQGMSK